MSQILYCSLLSVCLLCRVVRPSSGVPAVHTVGHSLNPFFDHTGQGYIRNYILKKAKITTQTIHLMKKKEMPKVNLNVCILKSYGALYLSSVV